MANWQSQTLMVDAIAIDVRAGADGLVLGQQVDGTYATDLLLTPEQARQLAAFLLTGADESESMTSNP